MGTTLRDKFIAVRLTAAEERVRQALEAYHGIDGWGVMRMGMLALAREAGIDIRTTS